MSRFIVIGFILSVALAIDTPNRLTVFGVMMVSFVAGMDAKDWIQAQCNKRGWVW